MAAVRNQKGNKKDSTDARNRIIVGKSKKNDPLASIVKVKTVAKPDCDQTIQAKKVFINVKAPKASARKKTLSCKPGDGTKGVNFRTQGERVDMRNGNGTHDVHFRRKRDR